MQFFIMLFYEKIEMACGDLQGLMIICSDNHLSYLRVNVGGQMEILGCRCKCKKKRDITLLRIVSSV